MFRKRFDLFGLRASVTACLSALALFASFSLSGCGGSSNPVSVTVTASAATVDATDSVTLTATVANDKTPGGVTWAVTGGGTLSNTTSSGATYTAPAASSSAVTATVTATSVADATKTATTTLTVPPAPTITTGALAAGTVGTAYSATLAGSGGIAPYTWNLTSGTLPAGLAINSAGVISGTPTAAAVGTTSLTFMLTDSGTATALTATQVLGLTIAAAPAIALPPPSSLPAATYKVAYAGSVAAMGGAGALTYSSSGALPTGLTLNASNGAISGIPTAVGTFTFTIKAADAFGDLSSATFTITVSYAPVKVTAVTLPTGYVGSNYTAPTLTATGGSGTGFTFALASGSALPAGLTLSPAGVLSGKPTTAGTTSFTVTATDSASNTGNGTFSITVNAAVSITTASPLPAGYVGSNYSKTFAATGGSGTGYTWAVTGGSTLPGGLTLSATGVLSGKPTTAGTPSFSITVTDSASNTAAVPFTITISAGVAITSPGTLPLGYQGSAYPGATLTATGGSGSGYTWTWAATGGSSLPAGLVLSPGGVISGLPTGSGTFNIVVTVTDSVGNTASATDSLTVQATLAISSGATLPGGVVGTVYSDSLVATGGSGGYTWTTNTAGTTSLATLSLTLSSAGVVSGTPTTTGTATFLGTVTDSASHTASLTFSVTVSNAPPLVLPAPNPGTLPSATVNQGYTGSISATGGVAPYTWTVTGLPSNGLSSSASGSTLSISGTPTATATVSFTASIKDSTNTTVGPNTYTIAVNSAGSQVSGAINLNNNCGGSNIPAITVSISTSPVQTTTTDTSGNYSFSSIPNGTYTITPSITGPTSVFYPASYTGVVVNNGTVSGENFSASLGYTVSGAVSYSGAQTGQVYLNLNSTNCGGSGGEGTSITDTTLKGGGAYTIRGVPPGSYTLQATMDNLGFGAINASNAL